MKLFNKRRSHAIPHSSPRIAQGKIWYTLCDSLAPETFSSTNETLLFKWNLTESDNENAFETLTYFYEMHNNAVNCKWMNLFRLKVLLR